MRRVVSVLTVVGLTPGLAVAPAERQSLSSFGAIQTGPRWYRSDYFADLSKCDLARQERYQTDPTKGCYYKWPYGY
jgi:hypothetical protein